MFRNGDNAAIYGTGATGRTNMLRGVYAEIAAALGPSTANPRGLGTHHLRSEGTSGTDANHAFRIVMESNETEFGIGAAFYLSLLPTDNNETALISVRDTGNTAQCTLSVGTTGTLRLHTGTLGGAVVAESGVVLTAGSYFHVEARFTIGDSGACEVRVNGATVLDVSGVDTQGSANAGAEQFTLGKIISPQAVVLDIADWFWWDASEPVDDDFLGDMQGITLIPAADDTPSDWTRNTGANDYEAIDDVTPDDDTTYVEAAAASDVSVYGLTDLPASVTDVIALISRPLLRKTDAGAGSAMVSVISTEASPETQSDGADRALNETYIYYSDLHTVDPATGVRWTPAAVNAAKLRLERTA